MPAAMELFNVPVYSLAVKNAVMAIFASDAALRLLLGSNSGGGRGGGFMPPLPEYKIDAFVQRKVAPGSEARQLVSAAKIRAGSTSENSSAAGDAAAVRRLEAFLDTFAALKPGDIASPQQWHAFVSGHAACGTPGEKSLHADALLSDIFRLQRRDRRGAAGVEGGDAR